MQLCVVGLTDLPVSCRVELGRALAKMGQKEAALQELEQAVTMEEEDINAHLQKVCRLRAVYPSHWHLGTRLSCGTGQRCGSSQLSQTTAVSLSLGWYPIMSRPTHHRSRLLSIL